MDHSNVNLHYFIKDWRFYSLSLNVFIRNAFSLLTYIKMSFDILRPCTISFHLSHCFYELISADSSLSPIQIFFRRCDIRMVSHLSELACVLSSYSLKKTLFNNLCNHRRKASFYHELSNVSKKKNAKRKRVSIISTCKAFPLCVFSNAHSMIFCTRILSCIPLFRIWK